MMVNTVESQKPKINRLLLILGCILIAIGVGGYYYFADRSLTLRVVGLLVALAIAVFVFLQTSQGRYAREQWLGAVQEVRKMVWPTRQETVHTTLAVLGMVIVMGLLLWTADYLLLRAVSWLTGQWGA